MLSPGTIDAGGAPRGRSRERARLLVGAQVSEAGGSGCDLPLRARAGVGARADRDEQREQGIALDLHGALTDLWPYWSRITSTTLLARFRLMFTAMRVPCARRTDNLPISGLRIAGTGVPPVGGDMSAGGGVVASLADGDVAAPATGAGGSATRQIPRPCVAA